MPWECKLIEVATPAERTHLPPGSLYYAPWLKDSDRLSLEYNRDWKDKRDPIVLVVPGYGGYCLDYMYFPDQGGHGWTITGEVPKITAHPSLGIGKLEDGRWAYHGWLKDGILSDDIDGGRPKG